MCAVKWPNSFNEHCVVSFTNRLLRLHSLIICPLQQMELKLWHLFFVNQPCAFDAVSGSISERWAILWAFEWVMIWFRSAAADVEAAVGVRACLSFTVSTYKSSLCTLSLGLVGTIWSIIISSGLVIVSVECSVTLVSCPIRGSYHTYFQEIYQYIPSCTNDFHYSHMKLIFRPSPMSSLCTLNTAEQHVLNRAVT